jgi:hypothetical protein
MPALNYIERLKADTAETNRLREEAKVKYQHKDTRLIAGWKPLVNQLEDLFSSVSPALLNRPWTVDDIIARTRITGRYNKNPSAGDVGQALRSLGWQPIRDNEGRRMWLPPDLTDRRP